MLIRFLRLFKEYREMEDALSAAVNAGYEQKQAYEKSFSVTRNDLIAMKKQINSDAALIETLNRHITALEGKAAMQDELITDLKQRLKALLTKPKNRKRFPKKKRP
jgi:outer membrane translocation and assembly module TamA